MELPDASGDSRRAGREADDQEVRISDYVKAYGGFVRQSGAQRKAVFPSSC
jgi:hypothetical protein